MQNSVRQHSHPVRAEIAVVIVTYGDRLDLVKKTTSKVLSSDRIARVILVDNGSTVPLTPGHFSFDDRVEVVRSSTNLGSASGFKIGIEKAISLEDIDFLAILDDDNLVSEGYFESLLKIHDEMGGGESLAFCAVRSDRDQYRELLLNSQKLPHIPDSVMGFSVSNLIKRKAFNIFGRHVENKPVRVRMIDHAPYGGLFVPINAIRATGLPREDFLLYGDDHEYTKRLSQNGVKIYLTDYAFITDIDQSWTTIKNSSSRWIDTTVPAWRIYYAARNQHYIELMNPRRKSLLRLNRLALLLGLYAEALLRHRNLGIAHKAISPFKAAIRDASEGRLGISSDYPLPFRLIERREDAQAN